MPNVIQSNTGNPSSIDCWWYRYWVCILNCITIIAESWTTVESLFTFSQIVASIVILVMARHENPQAPLFAWVVGYAVGCATSLAMLYKNHILNLRLYRLVNNYLEYKLLLFFDIWFVLGNIWVFRYPSSHQAPKLFSLCVVFLSFSYIWYAMIIISLVNLLIIQDHGEIEGATSQCINAMPTYIFKLQRNASHNSVEINPQVNEGGIMAAGTEKERVISGDDAECSICLASYEDNDKLKELPCSHLFHSKCIDKWLRKRSLCPLCKRKTQVQRVEEYKLHGEKL